MLFLSMVACAAAAAAMLAAAVPPRRARAAEVVAGYASRPARQLRAAPAVPRLPKAVALRLSRPGVRESLARRLALAGDPAGWTADRMLGVKGLAMFTGTAIGVLWGLRSPGLLAVTVAAGAGAGFFLPDVLLYNAGSKRQANLVSALPDAVDLLTICVEAGLGFDQALHRVASATDGPLGAEISRALTEIQIGRGRADALRDMAARCPAPDLRVVVSSLVQAGELGMPLASVLRGQAGEIRRRRRQRAEAKAQQVSVRVLFPLVFCLFPALFIFVMGPAALSFLRALSGT